MGRGLGKGSRPRSRGNLSGGVDGDEERKRGRGTFTLLG